MKKTITLFLLLTFTFPLLTVNAQYINTVAGSTGAGFAGDYGQATTAELNTPSSVSFDNSGNMYIADTYNNRIRKVTPTGIIKTVAGNGTQGFSGDGGPDTIAELNHPTNVAFDKKGNMFIADQNNGRIREVNTSGNISTVAGTGTLGYSGDGGPATAAELNGPAFLAFDTIGDLFFTDYAANVVRQIDTNGIITTTAGIGVAGYSGEGGPATAAEINSPQGIAYDKVNNLIYFADESNNLVRYVSLSFAYIARYAGNGSFGFSGDKGSAVSATLWNPTGIALDSLGNLYLSDNTNDRVRRVNTSNIILTIAGNGNVGFSGDGFYAVSARLDAPFGLAVNGGKLYLADQANNRVRKITQPATINGINEITDEESGISVYPNPGKGVFKFSVTSDQRLVNSSVEIYNMLGEKVSSKEFTIYNSQFTIDISNQPAGLYLYRVLSKEGNVVGEGKLIIE